jgi:hypothetical protein
MKDKTIEQIIWDAHDWAEAMTYMVKHRDWYRIEKWAQRLHDDAEEIARRARYEAAWGMTDGKHDLATTYPMGSV